jgi:hypothetical protein
MDGPLLKLPNLAQICADNLLAGLAGTKMPYHVFLLRDPREVIPSFIEKAGEPRPEGVGLPQQAELLWLNSVSVGSAGVHYRDFRVRWRDVAVGPSWEGEGHFCLPGRGVFRHTNLAFEQRPAASLREFHLYSKRRLRGIPASKFDLGDGVDVVRRNVRGHQGERAGADTGRPYLRGQVALFAANERRFFIPRRRGFLLAGVIDRAVEDAIAHVEPERERPVEVNHGGIGRLVREPQ